MIEGKLENPSAKARFDLLKDAAEIVTKDRDSQYGDPEDNFRDIANLWSTYKGVTMTAMDVAIFCMLIKVARLKKTPGHRDSLLDIAGYAACAASITAWENRINSPPVDFNGMTNKEYAEWIKKSEPPTAVK